MNSHSYITTFFIGILRLTIASPTCPTQMLSNDVYRINDQQDLDQAVLNLTNVNYSQLNCATLSISNRENYSYKIDLVELLKIKSNFVITGLGLQPVKLNCMGISNDTNNPLSDLNYVGFYRLTFYDCKIPLWIENVVTVDMEEVTFR